METTSVRRRRIGGRQPPDEEARRIGARLRGLRTERGLSLAEVGAALGMSRTNWDHYESGRNRLMLHQIPEVARALGVGPEVLVERLGWSWWSPAGAALPDPIGPTLRRIVADYEKLSEADRVYLEQALAWLASLADRLIRVRIAE